MSSLLLASCALLLLAAEADAEPLTAMGIVRLERREAAPEVGESDHEALRRHAHTLLRARRFPEAIHAFERVRARAPEDADAARHLAQLLAWTGEYDRSIALYRQTIERDPSDLGVKSDLADVLAWANRLEEAERLYESVLRDSPEHHEALKGLARARLLRGDARGAAEVLDRALARYGDDPDLHRDRARLLALRGDLARALQSIRRAVALAPADADVQRHLADVLLGMGDWEAAAEAWLRVVELDPQSATAHVGLARAYLAMRKRALAEEHAARALRINPTEPSAVDLSAELRRSAGIAPVRTAKELLAVGAHVALLALVLHAARGARVALRRHPVIRALAAYAFPAGVALSLAAHLATGPRWRWTEEPLFEAVTQVLLFLGFAVAAVGLLRREPTIPGVSNEVVLAIGAHPDDIELGAGGTVLKLKASGAHVYGLTLSRGEQGAGAPADREREARRAAKFLGLEGYWMLDFPDARLPEYVTAMKFAIEARIRDLRPSIVLTHTDVDVHGDHRAVHAATREAARGVPTVLAYEDVSTPQQFTPDLFVDIADYMDEHLRACALHRTQSHRTYMDRRVIQGRAAHRGMQVGVSFAQAFRTVVLVR